MEYHEAANIYPLLEGKEFSALVEDIRKNGLRVPILTHEGKILDGRNRWRACEVAGIQPRLEEWDGQGSPVDAVVSYNEKRRHLEPGQLAVSALKAKKQLACEAKERQRLSAGRGKKVSKKLETLKAPVNATRQAAKQFGVNHQYVSDAEKIDRQAPELLKDVHEGKLPIQDAKKVASLPEESRAPLVREIVCAPTPQAKREVVKQALSKAPLSNARQWAEWIQDARRRFYRFKADNFKGGALAGFTDRDKEMVLEGIDLFVEELTTCRDNLLGGSTYDEFAEETFEGAVN